MVRARSSGNSASKARNWSANMTTPALHESVPVYVLPDPLDAPVGERQRVGDAFDADTGDRRLGHGTAREFRRHEHVYLIDGAGIEKTAEHFAAALNEHVGEATLPEFVE